MRNLTVTGRCFAFLVLAGAFVAVTAGALAGENLVLVVNAPLRPLIQDELTRYVNDLTAEGHTVTVRDWDLTVDGQRTPQDLKAYLAGLSGLNGAVFIGDLPVAYYNHAADSWQALFPCDFYFMTLGNVWSDTNSDGYFDQIAGTPLATIWVSRLKASGMSDLYSGRTEDELVRRYLDKAHRFRTGQLRIADQALLWAGDDWNGQTPASVGIASAYTNCTRLTSTVPGANMFWPANWNTPYETEYFMCHSAATYHATDGGGNTQVANADILRLFWNCWNCSSGNYMVPGYVAGARLFTPVNGLLAVASTKTGSMMPFGGFYNHLGDGQNHGYAFKEYFNLSGDYYNTNDYYISWRFGLTLLGDGTLKLGRHTPAVSEPNQPPVAVADTYTTSKSRALAITADLGVLRNDKDPNANLLTAALVSSVGYGTLSLNADGSFLYTPIAGFTGADSFSYGASDGTATAAPVTVTIAVVNSAPTANSQSVFTGPETPVAITLTATDANGDPLTYAVVTLPAHGTLTGTAPSLTYTPAPGQAGADSFTFTANDGTVDSNTATVTVTTLTLREPENPANTVNGLDYAYFEGSWNSLPDFGSLTPTTSGAVDNFTLAVRLRDDLFGFRFTGYVEAPADGFYTFYTSSDDGSKLYIGTTEVVNNDGLHGMQEQSGLIGLRAGKHALTVTFFEQGGGEGLTVSWSSSAIAKEQLPAARLWRPGSANTPPTIADIADQATSEDTPLTGVAFTVGDAETAAAALTVTATSSNTTLLPDANLALAGTDANRTIGLSPAANQSGTTTVTVTVSDGTLAASDTFILTVTAVNDPPEVVSAAWADVNPVTLPAGTTVHVVASDPDEDPLTYAWSKVSGAGTATFATAGAADSGVTFSAASTYVLRVTVSDGQGGSVTSDVSVTVNPGSGVDPRADVNHDGVVNALDLQIVIANFGQTVGSPGCDARADANADGVVNALDLQIVIANFGQTVP